MHVCIIGVHQSSLFLNFSVDEEGGNPGLIRIGAAGFNGVAAKRGV